MPAARVMLATEAMQAYVAAARLCVRRRGAAAAAAAGGGSSAPAARPFASSAAAAQLTTVARRRVPHTYDMDDDVRSVLLAAEARPKGGGAAAGEPEPAAVKTMRSAGSARAASQASTRAQSPASALLGAAVESTLPAVRRMRVAPPPQGPIVLGVDPDVSGALCVLRMPHSEPIGGSTRGGGGTGGALTAAVYDTPVVRVRYGKSMRRRHDARAIAELLSGLQASPGSLAFLEQPGPMPRNGSISLFGSGYGFGVWMGALAAMGFDVHTVRPAAWKKGLGLAGKKYTKDDSRFTAAATFPALEDDLKRKKDHGRAEAALIAVYGLDLTVRKPEPDADEDRPAE